jgi:hypothetical protein
LIISSLIGYSYAFCDYYILLLIVNEAILLGNSMAGHGLEMHKNQLILIVPLCVLLLDRVGWLTIFVGILFFRLLLFFL